MSSPLSPLIFLGPECGQNIPPNIVDGLKYQDKYCSTACVVLVTVPTHLQLFVSMGVRVVQLMVGQLQPVEGNISRRSGLSIGRYHQHSQEVLDFSKSPVDYLKVRPLASGVEGSGRPPDGRLWTLSAGTIYSEHIG